MTYKRVLPRDAFNEAKLLKCIGKLTLLIEDRMLPSWHYHYDGEPFNIIQDQSDGSISISNITVWYKKKQVNVFTPLNSKEAWPMLARLEANDVFMFYEDGDFRCLDLDK